MNARLIVVLFFILTTALHSQTLEVKPTRNAIVKEGPFGNAPAIVTLPAGTRVTQIGTAGVYYSVRLQDGRTGFSYKGNYIVVETGPPPPPPPAGTVTAAALLARSDVLKITIIDVEVGDSALIVCPEENGQRDILLIDAGESHDGARIRQELIKNGLQLTGRPVTRFYASHFDGDHVGSVPEIADLFQVVYDNGPKHETTAYVNAMTANHTDRRTIALTYNETFSGGVNVECVAVNTKTASHPGASPSSEKNDNSIALQISFGGFDYFTAGDLTFPVETDLIPTVKNCDVYHVNHHGSETTSSGLGFLQAIKPEVSIASNGHKYGHPRANVALRLINEIHSKFYQTNNNENDDAYHPDLKFVADDTFHSNEADEDAEGATGNITIVVDPVAGNYYVIMPGLPLSEATFPIEM